MEVILIPTKFSIKCLRKSSCKFFQFNSLNHHCNSKRLFLIHANTQQGRDGGGGGGDGDGFLSNAAQSSCLNLKGPLQ